MPKAFLVSIVEDDRFFRESMRRLMRSLGYAVETFSCAADFLASPCVFDATCLISGVQLPVMSGLELLDAVEQLSNDGQQGLNERRPFFGPNLGKLYLHACQFRKLAVDQLRLFPGLLSSYIHSTLKVLLRSRLAKA